MSEKFDLLLLEPDQYNRCSLCGCYGLLIRFYLSEWCLQTGASSESGIVYCEQCITKLNR